MALTKIKSGVIDSIDGIVIGGVAPAAGSFTTLSTTAGGATFAGNTTLSKTGPSDALLTVRTNTDAYAAVALLVANNDGGAIYNAFRSTTSGGSEHFKISGGAAVNTMALSTGGAERMRIDASGNVGIGVAPNAGWGSGATPIQLSAFSNVSQIGNGSYSSGFNWYESSSQVFNYISTDEATRYEAGADGWHRWFTANSGTQDAVIAFGSAKMALDVNGNLLVGQTTRDFASAGFSAAGSGETYITRDSNTPLFVRRNTTDGAIVSLFKDGNIVGNIGTNGGRPYFSNTGTGTGAVGISSGGHTIPHDSTGGVSDALGLDLGVSSVRWRNLYLSGGVYLGGTDAVNLLDNVDSGIHTITATPSTSGTITLDTNNKAAWQIIGKFAHITGRIVVNAVSSPVGAIELSLPTEIVIPNPSGTPAAGAGNVVVNNSTSTSGNFVMIWSDASPTLDIYLGDASAVSSTAAQTLSSGDVIYFSATIYVG